MDIQNLFSINNTFFTLWDYPMSYIEFFGTILNIWCVWLVAQKKTLNWPVGIVAVILFMALFYQIQLYSDFVEQIYFLITGFYGWFVWAKMDKNKEQDTSKVSFSTQKSRAITVTSIVVGTALFGYVMSIIHTILPMIFQAPASYPYLDAFTTVMSFAATILMIYKKIESWMLWILVDIIGIVLYYVKEVKFVSLLYVIFLALATKGLISWYQTWKAQK